MKSGTLKQLLPWTNTPTLVMGWDGMTWTPHQILRFEQSNWNAYTDFCATCKSTWDELMYRIKDYVQGRIPGRHCECTLNALLGRVPGET